MTQLSEVAKLVSNVKSLVMSCEKSKEHESEIRFEHLKSLMIDGNDAVLKQLAIKDDTLKSLEVQSLVNVI
jgi:hypothetical protein